MGFLTTGKTFSVFLLLVFEKFKIDLMTNDLYVVNSVFYGSDCNGDDNKVYSNCDDDDDDGGHCDEIRHKMGGDEVM